MQQVFHNLDLPVVFNLKDQNNAAGSLKCPQIQRASPIIKLRLPVDPHNKSKSALDLPDNIVLLLLLFDVS